MVHDQDPQRPLTETGVSASAPQEEILESGRSVRSRYHPAIWVLAGVAALVALLNIADHHDRRAISSERPVVSSPHPQQLPTLGCRELGCDRTDGPSRAIRSAFAKHVPGSIVVSEHTVYGRTSGDLVMRRRLVHAVTGNVEMKVAIARADVLTHRFSRPIHQIARHGYVFDFRFVGFYPPPRAGLLALADDARLISVQS